MVEMTVTVLEESGDRVHEVELVALTDVATDFEADTELEDNNDTDGGRDIALLKVILDVVLGDKAVEDVTNALLVNLLAVARFDIDEVKEGFEAVAIFVFSEVDETDGLAREDEDSPEFVGSADIDVTIDDVDVTVPGSIVPERKDDELAELVFKAVAKDETVLPPDMVGIFVPLTSAVLVGVREDIGEEETLTVMVPIVVKVWDDKLEALTSEVDENISVGIVVADDVTETEFMVVD